MTPVRGILSGLALAIAIGGAAPCSGVTLLFPGEGEPLPTEQGWLVFKTEHEVRVLVAGDPVESLEPGQGVHHVALPIPGQPDASVIIREADGTERRIPYAEEAAARFHGEVMRDECASCHETDERGCAGCHRWSGEDNKHDALLGQGCLRCHSAPRWAPRPMEEICFGCHEAFRDGKHPGLRHSVAAASDPLRPGRRFECVSCHDPHAPQCLSCLSRGELRSWCLKCHRTP